MSAKAQIGISIGVVAVAGIIAAVQLRGSDEQAASGGMKGHNHAAMAAGGDELKPVRLTRESARLIGVTFATAERRTLAPEVKTLGMVAYDETRLASLNPKIDGWVEHLYVDFTGAPVREGAPMLDLYSPKLVTAQEELILARRLADAASEGGRVSANAQGLLDSARRRLAYWDIPEDEIHAIEESGKVRKTLTLRAPASGIVVEKNVVEGDRIMPGMTVFRIADLSTVWLEAEVFEKDLALVREGQRATATFEAYPGRTFDARVTYVYPSVSMETRTGRIRLELPNPGLALRPGMYADIQLDVPAGPPLVVVPRSAVLSTGERSVVFVEASDGTLVPREVTTGRAVGREVAILSGVSEGDRVVSSAGFLIDAESNLGSAMGEDMGEAPAGSTAAGDGAGAGGGMDSMDMN